METRLGYQLLNLPHLLSEGLMVYLVGTKGLFPWVEVIAHSIIRNRHETICDKASITTQMCTLFLTLLNIFIGSSVESV